MKTTQEQIKELEANATSQYAEFKNLCAEGEVLQAHAKFSQYTATNGAIYRLEDEIARLEGLLK